MNLIYLTLFVCSFPVLSIAQVELHKISGKVLDSSGKPIPAVTIKINPSGKGTVTNSEGVFSLQEIESNHYTIEIRSIGYKAITEEVNLNNDLEMEFTMMESTLGLDHVVITGTMQPVFIKSSPVKVEVITSAHLNTYLPAAASGIVESVSLINGVQEVVDCGVCFTNSISINGLPGAYTAILIDGSPIYGNLASVYGLNGIPSMIIDRIEIVKGPNSTLYGSEAVAGVINIITKDPSDQPVISADIMGTSHLESFGNITLAPKIGKTAGYIGLNYAYINNFEDDNNDGFNDMINLDRVSLFSKWEIERPSGKKMSVAGKYYFEDRRNGVEAFLRNRNYKNIRGSNTIYGESIFTNRAELFGTYVFDTDINLKLDYSFSTHHQDSYYGADGYFADQQTAFGNLIFNEVFSDHDVTGGITARYQYYDDNTVATDIIRNGKTINTADKHFIPGIFLQDEWQVQKQLTFLGGMRLDHYYRHGFITAPRLSFKYTPGEWTTLRLNSGTGFRVVNLFTEDHAFVTGQRSVEIKEELLPERSYNLSFNLNHVYTLGASQGTVDLDAFHTYFTNKIIPDYDDPEKIVYSNTRGHAVSKGVGMNISQEFIIPLRINFGFNLQKATETTENKFGIFHQERIQFAPEWSGVFTGNYELRPKKIILAYTIKATGPMALPKVFDLDENGNPLDFSRPVRSAAFAIHNFQASKEIRKNLNVYAGVQNIFNFKPPYPPTVGYNDPNTQIGFSENFDTAYAFAPIHGREIYLGVSWNIRKFSND